MLSLFKIFVKTYVLTLFCIIALSAINLQDNSVIYQNAPNTKVVADTLIINKLFKQGYQFIDGPSDSLLFYFGKALVIIQNNLDEINTTQPSNFELINIYQNLKTRTFIEFGIEYFYQNNYKQALNYFNEALEIARLTDNKDLISECVNEIGIVFKNQGNYVRALIFYNEALDLAKLSTDTSWIASCQINIGNVYKEKGFLNIAQKYFLEALKIMESLGQKRRIAACYQNIGDIYHQQRDYQKALEYFTKSLNLAKNTNDKVRELTVYLNIGAVYLQTKQYQTARIFLEKALFLYDETGYQHEKDNCYLLLGKSWFYENDFELAISSYEKALHISKIKQDKSSIAEIEGNLAKVYFQLKNYNKALELYKSSLEAAQSIGLLELKIEVSSNLSQLYEVLGQPNLAFQFYKNFSQLKDSLFNAEKYKAIKEMEVKYESEKKEQQLALLTQANEVQQLKLNRRNRMLFVSLAGIILLLLIGYLLYNQFRLKSKHKAIELEQSLFRSQMNPHFIFNSLIAIQSYIYKKEPVVASDYLAQFADLVRLILENTREDFIPLTKETKTLHAYLKLQQLRFENKFNYTLQVDEDWEPETIMLPPMFAQPFVENAIEHGIRHKPGNGHVNITYTFQDKKCITITIEDDGVGRKKAGEIEKKKDHHSLALKISEDRLNILSKKYKYNFNLDVIDLTSENGQPLGTKVIISLPFKMK
jgi:sensor histidine kinase YesM